VFARDDRTVGLLVNEIVDIVESAVTTDMPAAGAGALGGLIIGGVAIVGLVLLLSKFKPGPSDTGETSWGYIILISILALFLAITYGALPLFKRRRIKEQGRIFPILILIVAAGAWIALFFFRDNENFADIWTTLVWIAFAVVIVGWLIYPIFKWYFTHFILTDRRLMLNWGILNKKSKIIPLDQINDISSSQNLFERIFNFGDVVMESAGEFGQQPFTNIGDPIEVRTLILQQRRVFEEGQASRSGREMASEGHSSIHAPQPVHFSLSITAGMKFLLNSWN